MEDLPVGKNLQDHGGTHVPFVLNSYIPDFDEKLSDPENIQQYIRDRTGKSHKKPPDCLVQAVTSLWRNKPFETEMLSVWSWLFRNSTIKNTVLIINF